VATCAAGANEIRDLGVYATLGAYSVLLDNTTVALMHNIACDAVKLTNTSSFIRMVDSDPGSILFDGATDIQIKGCSLGSITLDHVNNTDIQILENNFIAGSSVTPITFGANGVSSGGGLILIALNDFHNATSTAAIRSTVAAAISRVHIVGNTVNGYLVDLLGSGGGSPVGWLVISDNQSINSGTAPFVELEDFAYAKISNNFNRSSTVNVTAHGIALTRVKLFEISNNYQVASTNAASTVDAIFIAGSTTQGHINDNKAWTRIGGANHWRYGINISAAAVTATVVVGNDGRGARTADINDAGTGTITTFAGGAGVGDNF